ncbi:MAG TPA: hypothetical protein VJQ52_01460 [Steroidobacteraceae bacterium]|nr:hypothetical protein [Steroidobacteraceae bacterium]
MNRIRASSILLAALACCALPHAALADTIHRLDDHSGFYHHQSGWIFPEKIGEFSLVGIPGDINGTVDVGGYYAREKNGVRTVISVNVYAPDSAEPETRPASIKATPVTVEVSQKPKLRATKVVYKDGKTSRATAYFVDTGPWIVKIRASVPASARDFGPTLAAFVRDQRWSSLQGR